MIESNVDLFLLFAAALTLLWAAASDASRYTIPNAAVLALAAVFLPYALLTLSPLAVLAHAGVALAAFAVGAGLFALRIMGGGDVKLIAAVGLWAGPASALPALFVMAIVGGVLALAMVAASVVRTRLAIAGFGTPGPTVKSLPLPYGVAIAAAGWWALYSMITI
jgi:prepilin peptidase CpaA